ncbi:hypothetical protein M3210_19725 [Oceanobacillus luteolus]|uniref:Uncharacterized protein n=1 Tax=Oceanobacillus luteolus TaxID=1274358 RepID=A0ABW4HS27_9BACI|nr:hypothetical protein [Oceanobacillus luteolus]MCM3742426.1 hypothetical protein [Oceanobacillus luteolus]
MKKNIVIFTLACFLFVFTFSSTTHAYTAGEVTAYTGGTIGHGSYLFPNKQYQTVAVHQKSKTNKDPIFPFGSEIVTSKPLYLNGYGNKSLFMVTDTGDLDRKRDYYWFDVYFGTSNSTNVKNAIEFGTKYNIVYSVF